MKKIYRQPASQAIQMHLEGQILDTSTTYNLDNENKMDAVDAYSNKKQPASGPWKGGLWDEMK